MQVVHTRQRPDLMALEPMHVADAVAEVMDHVPRVANLLTPDRVLMCVVRDFRGTTRGFGEYMVNRVEIHDGRVDMELRCYREIMQEWDDMNPRRAEWGFIPPIITEPGPQEPGIEWPPCQHCRRQF